MYSLLSYPNLADCLCLLAYSDEMTAQLMVNFLAALSEFPCHISGFSYPRCQLDVLFSILPNSLVTQSMKQCHQMEITPRKCCYKHVSGLSCGRFL